MSSKRSKQLVYVNTNIQKILKGVNSLRGGGGVGGGGRARVSDLFFKRF